MWLILVVLIEISQQLSDGLPLNFVRGPPWIYPDDFCYPLTIHPALTSGQQFNLSNTFCNNLKDFNLNACLFSHYLLSNEVTCV